MTKATCFVAAVAAFCGLALTADRAVTAGFDRDIRSTCTDLWCDDPRIIAGTYRSYPGSLAAYEKNTWTYQVLCRVGDCCRIGTMNNQGDPVMMVVGPGVGLYADVYLNDDSDEGDTLNTLIKIDPVPITGAYTIIVADFLLSVTDDAGQRDFEVWYKTYNEGNPNCSNPTPPYIPVDAAASSAEKVRPAE